MRVVIPTRAFNPVYRPLLRDREHRYIVLMGGAGSGKSFFAAQRLLVRLMESPLCNLLVVRATAVSNRDSTYALLRQLMSAWGVEGLFKYTGGDLRIVCKNGNTAIFKGLDDPEKLKSVTFPKGELTDVWVEEASEVTQEQFNHLDLRLRGLGGPKQMTLSFNPVSNLHWLKRRFFDQKDLRALVLKTTYRDNRFLDPDYIRTLESYRDSDPYFYQVYCLGEWGVMGRCFFDAEKISERLRQSDPPLARGDFIFETVYSQELGRVVLRQESIRFAEGPGGFISVYQKPEPGASYVIGGDTAGEGSDYFVAQVVCRETGRQACTLRGRMDEDLYARQVYCLGRWYNWALTAVESNFSGYPLRELEGLGYPCQYMRTDGQFRPSYGFRTTQSTRPVILAGLVEVVREHPDWLYDPDTLGELLTFVRNSRGRPEAQTGAHDDCVMALAIAYYVRGEKKMDSGVQIWSYAVDRA